MPIVQAGDPVLRRRAEELPAAWIGSPEMTGLIEALQAALREVPGVGVAAPQIGVARRVVLVQDPEEYHQNLAADVAARMERSVIEPYVLINPELEPVGPETATFFEGCLSVEGYRALVPRFRSVRVTYLDPTGARRSDIRTGWHARILQHEVDHLDGVLYVDRMLSRSLVSAEHYPRWAEVPTEEVARAFGLDPT